MFSNQLQFDDVEFSPGVVAEQYGSEEAAEIINEVTQEDVLEDWLFNINENNFFYTQYSIVESVWLDDADRMSVFVDKIFDAAKARPSRVELYIRICQTCCSHVPQLEQVISKAAFQMPHENMFFVYKWLSNFPERVEKVAASGYLSDDAMFWFAPEIERYNNSVFERKLLGMISRSADDLLVKDFTININRYRDDNWSVYRELRERGINPCPAAVALRLDDIASFQVLAAKDNVSMNQRIDVSIFERCAMVNHRPTWIQFAAFFGAVKCFKFLILNGADLQLSDDPMWNDFRRSGGRTLTQFAVAGADTEIIRICFDKINDLEGCDDIANEYHLTSIAEWVVLMKENTHVINRNKKL